MSSYGKYIMMGVSSLLLPLAKIIIQKLIGKAGRRIKVPGNDYEEEMGPDVPQRLS
ncbi:MAG: hypothetical protein HY787_01165 [Deltaproteobacteria bacterium]|nr:hypothetical protein [Deltaproteobacteria bacterium]